MKNLWLEQKIINNRFDWMDWAKTIAITLVVFGHILMPFSKWIFNALLLYAFGLFAEETYRA